MASKVILSHVRAAGSPLTNHNQQRLLRATLRRKLRIAIARLKCRCTGRCPLTRVESSSHSTLLNITNNTPTT